MSLVKRITVYSPMEGSGWGPGSTGRFLCYGAVADLFVIPVDIREIDICLFDRPVRDAYFVRPLAKGVLSCVVVTVDSVEKSQIAYLDFANWLPAKGGYVAIEYEEPKA